MKTRATSSDSENCGSSIDPVRSLGFTEKDSSDEENQDGNIVLWERIYEDLDRSVTKNNFSKADKLCGVLCDTTRWSMKLLNRPWSNLPGGKIRPWRGDRPLYPKAYRVVDGIREAWICLLMDYCLWDRAVKIADIYIYDERCMYLTGKAQMSLNKLHGLLESRRMREAFGFFTQLLDGSHKMTEILREVERLHTFQWNYTLARIHFLHNELDKAQHHSELACGELERSKSRQEECAEPLQQRMWVNMIRAWTRGLASVVSQNAADVNSVLELWERSVCDLDRKSVHETIGLTNESVFGRLKFVEFLMIAVRAFPELEVNTYADSTLPENSSVISIGKALLRKLRKITDELVHKGHLSVEVTSHKYHPLLDQALTQLGYLSTTLEGLLNNWVLVIDAGPVGNQGRFANHTDDPNAVLAIGEASGIRVRVVTAIKAISPGDEITVHYGPNYWDTVLENRQSSISRKYKDDERHMGPSKKVKRNNNDISAASGHHYQQVKQRYAFKFFDGIVPDINGSGLPALVLLQSLGETGTCSEAYDIEASCAHKGLKIQDCPKSHAAFPGKMLLADRHFQVGQQICIYAGVMSRMPEAQLKLNESDYISTVCNATCGPFGFELDDISASTGCVFKKIQRDLPTLTPLTRDGLSIPNAQPPTDLSAIHDIRGLGPDCTKRILQALQEDPPKRELLSKLFKKLRSLPEKQWKIAAQSEVRKVLPPPPSTDEKVSDEKSSSPVEWKDPESFWFPQELRNHLAFVRNKENQQIIHLPPPPQPPLFSIN